MQWKLWYEESGITISVTSSRRKRFLHRVMEWKGQAKFASHIWPWLCGPERPSRPYSDHLGSDIDDTGGYLRSGAMA